MKNFLFNLLDWIYKKKCYLCGCSRENKKICSKCYNNLQYLSLNPQRIISGCNVYCAAVYENELQKIIRGVKYHNQRELAYFQAKFMYEYWKQLDENNRKFQIVPIPLFSGREKKRKYNHMFLVAEEFAKLSGYDVNNELVERIKDTKPQYKLNKAQRMENLASAFKIHKEKLLSGDILLFDDICTTGSTFENIIKEFKKHEITNILCFATTTPFSNDNNVEICEFNTVNAC